MAREAKTRRSEYRATLRMARGHLKRLYRQRDELEREIATVRQTVITLGWLCGESLQKDYLKETAYAYKTLTEAVMGTILSSAKPTTATAIRDVLEDVGYEMPASNPLASIHSVLKRLWQQKHIGVLYKRSRVPEYRGRPELTERYYWYIGENSIKAPKEYVLVEGWARADALQADRQKKAENSKEAKE